MLRARLSSKYRRVLVHSFARQSFPLSRDNAYISFTFDDFPRSAYLEAGSILRQHDAHGTYYVAMQLLGRESPSGRIATPDDLRALVADGHELGCHTFGHVNGATASVDEFIRSVSANQEAFQRIVPGGRFRTFAYPFDGPRLAVKRAMVGRFLCCRGGGQTLNRETVDLALVNSYFIDQRNANCLDEIAELIARNAAERGWLVFSTHDVAAQPSSFGCRPEFFDAVVHLARRSAARVLTVAKVCEELGVGRANVARTLGH
jgi:peptidoglycan/xylan/chitin deacetylase (PgdA/CDA1 family)